LVGVHPGVDTGAAELVALDQRYPVSGFRQIDGEEPAALTARHYRLRHPPRPV
jgi:hypothetical protein